jgi:hypothetical protein
MDLGQSRPATAVIKVSRYSRIERARQLAPLLWRMTSVKEWREF